MWAGGNNTLECQSVTGNRLSIPFINILGVLPPNGYNADGFENVTNPMIKLVDENKRIKNISASLQMWSFQTTFGRLTLPSIFVTSFTRPQNFF
jgi:hypothetical protein